MPTCYITTNENIAEISDEKLIQVRDILAEELMTKRRYLDRNHICLRLSNSRRQHMLGDVELEVFCQFYFPRFLKRDAISNQISKRVSECLSLDCATWINLSMVGYSRYTKQGESFFSD